MLHIPLSVLLVLGPVVLVGAGELVIDSAEMVEEDSTASELVGSTVGSTELEVSSTKLEVGSSELEVVSIELEVSSTGSVEKESVEVSSPEFEMIERVSIVPDKVIS